MFDKSKHRSSADCDPLEDETSACIARDNFRTSSSKSSIFVSGPPDSRSGGTMLLLVFAMFVELLAAFVIFMFVVALVAFIRGDGPSGPKNCRTPAGGGCVSKLTTAAFGQRRRDTPGQSGGRRPEPCSLDSAGQATSKQQWRGGYGRGALPSVERGCSS